MRGLASIVLLAGCSQILGLSNFQTASDGGGGSDGGIADAGTDAPIDGPPAPYACSELGSALAVAPGHPIRRLGSNAMYPSFGSAACALFAAGPGSAVMLAGSNTFATSDVADPDPYIQHGSGEIPIDAVELALDTSEGSNITVEVMVVSTFHLEPGAILRPIGPSPVVILATGDITIDGTLDVSAGSTTGSAASPCHAGSGGQFTGMTADGAAGGAFQGSGGEGGGGFNGGTNTAAPPPTPVSNVLYFPYRGCQGGPGGDNGLGSPAPSFPGGAVYLVSETGISVTGAINAGGQGGQYNDFTELGGGGGGASGGTILLEAPNVTVSGVLAANGGGGASGTDLETDGMNGANGGANSMRTPGGGSGAGGGGLGAAGTFINGAPGMPGMSTGGGGGGGGAGFIVIHHGSQLVTSSGTGSGTISPAPTVLPMP